jgi:hypothetical protein
MMFKILPDRPVDWQDVWLGAAVTAVYGRQVSDQLVHWKQQHRVTPVIRLLRWLERRAFRLKTVTGEQSEQPRR